MTKPPAKPPLPTDLSCIQLLAESAAATDAAIDSNEVDGIDALIALLVGLNRHRDQMKFLYEEVSKRVSDAMGTMSEYNAPEGVTVEKKWSKSRSGWRHAELAKEVAHRIDTLSIDPDTGELTLSREEAIVALLEYIAPSYWRVNALRSISLEPDDWCEAGEAKPSIIVRNARP